MQSIQPHPCLDPGLALQSKDLKVYDCGIYGVYSANTRPGRDLEIPLFSLPDLSLQMEDLGFIFPVILTVPTPIRRQKFPFGVK